MRLSPPLKSFAGLFKALTPSTYPQHKPRPDRRPNADDRGNGGPTFPVLIRKRAAQPFGRT
jgi:hypothetical protein